MLTKLICLAVILVGANCRYLIVDTHPKYVVDSHLLEDNDLEDVYEQNYESVKPMIRYRRQGHGMNSHLLEENDYQDGFEQNYESVKPMIHYRRQVDGMNSHLLEENDYQDGFEQNYESVKPMIRHRRQAHGMMNTNPDGSANVMGKFPITGNDKNILSAIGGISRAKDGGFKAGSAGLALDNVNGHGLSLTGTHLPNVGNQLTGAGKVNLFHNDNHDLAANAFATRTFPSNPNIPNFNTVGGSMDYMYKNKIGGSLGMSHTDLFKQTDYSAMGKLNLFRNPTSTLDFSAGATRSMSPYMPHSSWQPSAGLTFTKYF